VEKILDVWKMRKKLKPYGIEIKDALGRVLGNARGQQGDRAG